MRELLALGRTLLRDVAVMAVCEIGDRLGLDYRTPEEVDKFEQAARAELVRDMTELAAERTADRIDLVRANQGRARAERRLREAVEVIADLRDGAPRAVARADGWLAANTIGLVRRVPGEMAVAGGDEGDDGPSTAPTGVSPLAAEVST